MGLSLRVVSAYRQRLCRWKLRLILHRSLFTSKIHSNSLHLPVSAAKSTHLGYNLVRHSADCNYYRMGKLIFWIQPQGFERLAQHDHLVSISQRNTCCSIASLVFRTYPIKVKSRQLDRRIRICIRTYSRLRNERCIYTSNSRLIQSFSACHVSMRSRRYHASLPYCQCCFGQTTHVPMGKSIPPP